MECKYRIGQVIVNSRFGYRGVIVAADATFVGTETWYHRVEKSEPPKDEPWYRVLVEDGTGHAYVAERHLEPDPSAAPVNHPDLPLYFDRFEEGRYSRSTTPPPPSPASDG